MVKVKLAMARIVFVAIIAVIVELELDIKSAIEVADHIIIKLKHKLVEIMPKQVITKSILLINFEQIVINIVLHLY